MRLTSAYTRVAAPHGQKCPHCKRKVWDWYIEWYDLSIKAAVFNGLEAMDCPWCREPVVYDSRKDLVNLAPEGTTPNQRSLEEATKYAQKKGYPDLEEFLVSPQEARTATPFRFRYWLTVDLPIRKTKS
jgi:hypothetical protein